MVMIWMVLCEYLLIGLCGGEDVCLYQNWYLVGMFEEFEVMFVVYIQMLVGGVMVYQNGGGLGFGLVIRCDLIVVCEDVFDELVSLVVVCEIYGVVFIGRFDDYNLEVDWVVIEVLWGQMVVGCVFEEVV